MLDRYIQIKDTKGIAGQRANDGVWYCKEMPFDDVEDFFRKAKEMNIKLNILNKGKTTKEKKAEPKVKGLK